MVVIHDYGVAVLCCVLTMLCWGSWGNTQKLAAKTWRFEYFYWDYVIGILLFSVVFAFTLGSVGSTGRSFIPDLMQADPMHLGSAFLGGIIFNAANILLSAAIAICGMSVAFPVGIGLALVLGVMINYFSESRGNPIFIFSGVLLIAIAIICNSLAYRKAATDTLKVSARGIFLSLGAGLIMSFFFRFIASAVDLSDFDSPAAGKLTPYTAVVIFSIGVLMSNFIFNTIAMKFPVAGKPIAINGYFKGEFSTHLVGILGGCIWCLGQSLSLLASGKAGAAIAYGLGQGATLVSAAWGIFIWKEFKDAPIASHQFNKAMFLFFIAGLAMLVYAGW